MPDMTDLPFVEDIPETPETIARIAKLREEVEALRLRTPEDNVRYWLSDEAMGND